MNLFLMCPSDICHSSEPCVSSMPITEVHSEIGGDITGHTSDKERLVYSRREKKVYDSSVSKTLPESEPVEVLEEEERVMEENSDQGMVDDSDLPIALRKKPRSCTLHPIEKYVSYKALSPKYHAFVSSLDKVEIPKNIHEALKVPEWKDVVMEEMRALKRNETWEEVDLPGGKKPVGCKWVFTVKYNSDGSVERYKARLVAKGFTQTYGMDYTETFAPVAKLNTIRVLLSIAANLDWPLCQLDIKNAFLNGDLKEEVYMTLPPGFGDQNNRVCKLKKSLYGLKQSTRAWFERFTQVLKAEGYTQGHSDHTLFFKHNGEKRTILIVYVDDIILTGDDNVEMEKLRDALSKEFEVKNLGEMKYFLGMEVAQSKKGIYISQRKYILDLLKETGMLGCKPSSTPVEGKNSEDDGKTVDKERYQQLVGKLIYLSHTRPNIAFAVSVARQHMHSPKEKHLEAVYKILRYLKGTPGRGLLFRKCNQQGIEIYTDAD